MTGIQHLTLEVPESLAHNDFPNAAFGLGDVVRLAATDAATSGFRGFSVSLVVGQPSTVDSLVASALAAGARTLKPPTKSFWGYGAVVEDPGGAIWKLASSSKKDTGPATRHVDSVVLLLGVADVKASRRFYEEHGLRVAKSFGSKYVEFDAAGSAVTLALYGRKAAAKDVGVAVEGSGSHRLVVGGDLGSASPVGDPDGFVWLSPAAARHHA